MIRLLVVIAAGVPFAIGGFGIGTWWARRGESPAAVTDREVAFRERMMTLDHHTALLERSRRAMLDGEPGLAQIYSEAAERVLKLTEG